MSSPFPIVLYSPKDWKALKQGLKSTFDTFKKTGAFSFYPANKIECEKFNPVDGLVFCLFCFDVL